MFTSFAILAGGLALLCKSADWLVSGSASLARRLGIKPIVIGLTVVAFGTSTPEMFVNLTASFAGKADIAIGNILGSNIANILLVLGVAAVIRVVEVKRATVLKEIPLALLASAMVWLLAGDRLFDGAAADVLGRVDGFVLLAFFVIFVYYVAGIAACEPGGYGVEAGTKPLRRSLLLAVAGLAGLSIGGKLVVDGAVDIAHVLGLSERLVGLTIVAVGTSLPELMTSAVAAYRREADIAVGNVVGSNIFNVFWVLGLSAVIHPLPFHSGNASDAVIAVAATLLLLAAMYVGKRHILERWQGGVFIGLYVCYLAVLVYTG